MKRFLRNAWEIVVTAAIVWSVIIVGIFISLTVCLIVPAVASCLGF